MYFLKGKSEILGKKVFEPKGHRRGSAFKMQNITFRNLALSALKNPQLMMTSHIIWFRMKKKNHFYPLAILVPTKKVDIELSPDSQTESEATNLFWKQYNFDATNH